MLCLSQIQAFVKRKTQTLPRLLTLHGKIEMAKRTLELRKMKKKASQPKPEAKTLVYHDADEGEDEDMEQDGSEESDGSGEEGEEEIEQIPIAKPNKRRQVDRDEMDSDDDAADALDGLDASVSEDEDED